MAFNIKMFKQKKKRAVDPNAPPRPNLLRHEKTLKENATAFSELQETVRRQEQELERLRAKLNILESTINIIGHSINNKR